jgi:enolase-phosphatase E1
MGFSLQREKITDILMDIEGTTTPIAFVHEVLFPFARARVKDYLEKNYEVETVQKDLIQLRGEQREDQAANRNPPSLKTGSVQEAIDSIVSYVFWLMDQDRKSTGLKALQGRIWQEGYAAGELQSEVFPEVAPALVGWHTAGFRLSIFSSGSVLAQKLLFAHTKAGDLTKFLDCYFDTATGSKSDARSYRDIATALQQAPEQILFISDVLAELDAARTAGMKTLLCVRPGNRDQPVSVRQQRIQSFAEITR